VRLCIIETSAVNNIEHGNFAQYDDKLSFLTMNHANSLANTHLTTFLLGSDVDK